MSALEKITDWLKLGGKIVIPKTYASCVYDTNGQTVEARLNEVFRSVSEGKSKIAAAITD